MFLENGGSNIPRSGSITEIQDIIPLAQQNNNKNKPDVIQKQVLLFSVSTSIIYKIIELLNNENKRDSKTGTVT